MSPQNPDPCPPWLGGTKQLLVDFTDEFGGELFTMPDEQFYIYLTDSYEPFNVHVPRPVPYM